MQRIITFPDGFTNVATPSSSGYVTQIDFDAFVAQKGAANGLASLDGSGKLSAAQIPSITISDTFVVASQVAMLTLTAQTGDVAVRTDLNKSFILAGANPATLAHWQELLTPTDAVQSVNGMAGTVVLDAPNIGSTPSGNLAASNVGAALNELQSDIDTRAPSASPEFTGPLTLTEIATPSAPAATKRRFYTKSDGLMYHMGSNGIETPVGSGSGSGGINFVGLNPTWGPGETNNRDFELTTGTWAAYADIAGATPVDMTGGVPVVAVSRTTTAGEVLNGNASGKIVKDAANRQGEGVSCLFNVPPGYQGKTSRITIPYKVISGSLVQGDLKAFIYNVTTPGLVTPFANDVLGSIGTLSATFTMPGPAVTPANIQLRVGFHFASTSTTAVTIAFDDVTVGPEMDDGPAIASTTYLSTLLASGTRVTATPTALGQYRAFQKSASASSGVDAAPTTTPSLANGIALGAFTWATAGSGAFNISRYETFIGINKNVLLQWYSGTGKTGHIAVGDSHVYYSGDTVQHNPNVNYDPTTGVLVVDCNSGHSGVTGSNLGVVVPLGGGSRTLASTAYFDVAISEAAVPVQITNVRSEIFLTNGNGHGSTNTAIRRYTTAQINTGSAMTYADSAANGMSITLNQEGVYSVSVVEFGTVGSHFGVSKNSNQLTSATGIVAITAAHRLTFNVHGSGSTNAVSTTFIGAVGDVIRAHTDGGPDGTGIANTTLRITKVSN